MLKLTILIEKLNIESRKNKLQDVCTEMCFKIKVKSSILKNLRY